MLSSLYLMASNFLNNYKMLESELLRSCWRKKLQIILALLKSERKIEV